MYTYTLLLILCENKLSAYKYSAAGSLIIIFKLFFFGLFMTFYIYDSGYLFVHIMCTYVYTNLHLNKEKLIITDYILI